MCREKGNSLFVPDVKKARLLKSDLGGNEVSYDGLQLKTGQCGSFQAANILTAAEVCRAIAREGYMISDENIEQGISSFFIPGRLECVSREPFVILDSGHNEGAVVELKKTLSLYSQNRRVIALCAFMKDKDYKKAIELLAPACDEMIFTNADSVRGEGSAVLCKSAEA